MIYLFFSLAGSVLNNTSVELTQFISCKMAELFRTPFLNTLKFMIKTLLSEAFAK